MTRTFASHKGLVSVAALLLAGTAMPAWAQDAGYGSSSGGYGTSYGSSAPAPSYEQAGPAPAYGETAPVAEETTEAPREKRRRGGRGGSERRQVNVSPYLEVGQVLQADLKNGGDVLTYTSVAVGADANIVTRRAELAASVRYEHRFGESGGIGDQDVVSGLARGRLEVVRGLNLEAGALASRTRADGQGADNGIIVGNGSNVANVYSVYAGPTLTQQVGGFDIGAGYRFGYTKVDVDTPAVLAPGAVAQDVFDSSTNHAAWGSIGQRPGMLPFGWQLSAGYEREDTSQLDQRYEGKYARADATLPIGRTFSVLGGVGYEKIEVSQRDPLLDAGGNAVRDANGRFVTDPASARQLSFETDGLIWDAGVMWQPSNRTSLTAKVGRRYGDTIFTGSFSYRPNHAMLFQVGAYDGLSSFGRQLSGGLAALPTQFDINRNPIDGDIGECVFGQQGGGCLSPSLGSATAAQFRSRGVQALLSSNVRGWNLGLGLGYDQRRLLAPNTGVLAGLNGNKDENYYLFLSVARQLDRDSDIGLTGYVNYFDNGAPGASDVQSAGATVNYSRRFWRGLTGTAAASINSFDQDGVNSQLLGSALVGLRYNF